MNEIKDILQIFEKQKNDIHSQQDFNEFKITFFGKKGLITSLGSKVSNLEHEERRLFGVQLNALRSQIQGFLEGKQKELSEQELQRKVNSEKIDVSLPCRSYSRGTLHPITHTIRELKNIFRNMGLVHVDGPEIEDEWHNFSALNIPETHPARQMHDTFYLKNIDKLLRTHTSCVQIRYMQENKPPFGIVSSGRVYRSEHDATHTPMFHQMEALVIGRDINFGHLKNCLSRFLCEFFEIQNLPMRLRASYFPFTEPSAEVDIQCDRSRKDTITIGQGDDWLEILGCGMVHHQVLRNVGIDPEEYQGFAFGVGIERLAMLKYQISDLRKFFEGDIRWNEYYGF